MLVTVQHLHSVPNFNGRRGYCAKGAREWFRRHGLDWTAFVRDGIDAEFLLATGDAMALRVVQHAVQAYELATEEGV